MSVTRKKHMQSTVFGMSAIAGQQYLSAACEARVVTVPLAVTSVSVENSLQSTAGHAREADKTPRLNKFLNYFHSLCERFPVDDALKIAESRWLQVKGSSDGPRKVSLHMVNSALLLHSL
jgi:hypothetical protein